MKTFVVQKNKFMFKVKKILSAENVLVPEKRNSESFTFPECINLNLVRFP